MIDIVLTIYFVVFGVYGTYKFIENIWVKAQVFQWALEEFKERL